MESPNIETRQPPQHLEPRLWVKVVIVLLFVGVVVGIASRFADFTIPSKPFVASSNGSTSAPQDPNAIEVTSPLTGLLLKVNVAEGARVAPGQVIAEIDAKPMEPLLALAKSRFAVAEAEVNHEVAAMESLQRELPLRTRLAEEALALAKAQRAVAEAVGKQADVESEGSIAEARAGLESARVARDFAKKDLDRFAVLSPDEAATLRRSQEATKTFALSVAQLKQAEARVAAAEASRGRVEVAKQQAAEAVVSESRASTELELAKAAEKDRLTEAKRASASRRLAVEEAKRAVEIAKSASDETKVRSTTAGVVVRVLRRAGDGVAIGSPILVLRSEK